MSKIIFLDSPIVYTGEFSQIGEHQVRLLFVSKPPQTSVLLSGFRLVNEHNNFIQTRREDYKFLYRIYEENPFLVELCNDNIKYQETESDVITNPVSQLPSFEEILENKINELSSSCKSVIEAGLNINGLHYSYSLEDQINLKEIFDTVKDTNLPYIYHSNGKKCNEYSPEELIEIYHQLRLHKYRQKIYFNLSREYLKSLAKTDVNKELISSYKYGTPLSDTYLETYNTMIALIDNHSEQILTAREEIK